MEIIKIKVGKSESDFEIKRAAVGKGRSPPGVDFILTEKQFSDLKIGDRIGATGLFYYGLEAQKPRDEKPTTRDRKILILDRLIAPYVFVIGLVLLAIIGLYAIFFID